MNVEHKVSYAPGREPVSIVIIPPVGSLIGMFHIEDVSQDELQALLPAESRQYTQTWLDAHYADHGLVVVIPQPPAPPQEEPA
jgi:hypothetical protein